MTESVDKIHISWEKKKYKQVQKKSSQFLGNLPDYALTYPDILKIRYYQSASLLHLGKDNDSWKLMKKLYNDMLSVFGADAVMTLETLKSLGTLALKLKRKEFTEWQKLIENRSHRSNVNHDVTLNILNAIAVGENEAKQIEPVYNKVLNQILNNHSNRSEIVLKTMIHKTKNMLGCGRKVNALQEARKLRQNIVSVLGRDSALATEALKVKAKCLRVLDRHEEALDAYDDMYNDAKSLGGKFDTKSLEILMGKAKCLTDMKNLPDAISLYDELYWRNPDVSRN
ncbi:hypothetical protein B566_EDAN009514 [Ephemera danica]|nr:hypothetical protein B566_EDAN009514 [Ephemera danica]